MEPVNQTKIIDLAAGPLHRRNGHYFLASTRIMYEDAIGMLADHASAMRDQPHQEERYLISLARRVPQEDLEAVKAQLSIDAWRRGRARNEAWIIQMLRLIEPPSTRFEQGPWEELHQVAVEPLDEIWRGKFRIMSELWTFTYPELWKFVQKHKLKRSPLRLFEVSYSTGELDGHGDDIIGKSRVWAFNAETVRGSWIFDDLISVKEIVPVLADGDRL